MTTRNLTASLAISIVLSAALGAPVADAAGAEPSAGGSLSIRQPGVESPPRRFDVLVLTAQEEAHLRSLTARALGDASREGSLASFWAEALLEITSRQIRGVSDVYAYETGAAPPSDCAPTPSQAAGNASYCPLDESMAYDKSFIRSLYATYGDVTPLAVLAHEWGHHVQALAGFPTVDKAAELQADCYAGMYLRHLDDIGLLEAGDTSESLAFFYDIGDDRLDPSWNPEWFDAGVHGNSYERSQAQGVGYASGDPEYCQAYEDWADRPPTRLGGDVTLRRPPGTSVRVIPDDMHEFETPNAKVSTWATAVPSSTAIESALEKELERRLGEAGDLEIESTAPGLLASNRWASGDGLRADFRWTAADGNERPGSAEIQVHPDGSAEVFASFPLGGQDKQAQSSSSEALDALLWGYCDPRASFPVNCAVRPSASGPPQVNTPRATQRPAPRDTADKPPSVTENKARQWQQQLMKDAAGFGCTPWTKKQERRWTPRDNAYDHGAVTAIQCDNPDTGLKQLAMFRFPDRDSLEAYWNHKLSIISKRLRRKDNACFTGEPGITGWTNRSGASRGLVACYKDGVAKIRWYNLRNNTYGILDANHKSIQRLVDWWRVWSP